MNDQNAKQIKPLGRKAFGSIPHLPGSRMGPADHSCHQGQEVICCEKPRDKHDRIIVTEKLDGSCMSLARQGGQIIPLGRAGFRAGSSPYPHLREFEDFAKEINDSALAALKDGERFVGEWMNVATGTKYRLNSKPFIIFGVMRGAEHLPWDYVQSAAEAANLPTAKVLSDGPPVSIAEVLSKMGEYGFHGALEIVEGAVWRVERRGAFDFHAKYVRHDKIDGKYLPGLHGNGPAYIFNDIEATA